MCECAAGASHIERTLACISHCCHHYCYHSVVSWLRYPSGFIYLLSTAYSKPDSVTWRPNKLASLSTPQHNLWCPAALQALYSCPHPLDCHLWASVSLYPHVSSYLLCLTAATRSGPENMENKLSPLADDVSSLELAESPWAPDQLLCRPSLKAKRDGPGPPAAGQDPGWTAPRPASTLNQALKEVFTLQSSHNQLAVSSPSSPWKLELFFLSFFSPGRIRQEQSGVASPDHAETLIMQRADSNHHVPICPPEGGTGKDYPTWRSCFSFPYNTHVSLPSSSQRSLWFVYGIHFRANKKLRWSFAV